VLVRPWKSRKKPEGIKILYFFAFDLFDLGIAGAMGEEMADEEKNIKKNEKYFSDKNLDENADSI
jgi:hypothetical protein